MKTKRAFLVAPRKIEIREIDIEMNDDQVLIKVASCGLCNWEQNHWKGLLWADRYPFALGHEYAGTVIEVGKNVTKLKVGDKVASLSGMQGFGEYAVCDPVNTFRLDDCIDPKYALGEPLECVTTVLTAAAPCPGDYGVILCCGTMGKLCTLCLKGNLLAGLIAVDIDERKLALARQFGATATVNPLKENAVEKVRELTEGHMADFVIEGTGRPATLNEAQDYVKVGRGRLLLMSSHEEACREFDFRKAIDRGLDLLVPHPSHSISNIDDMRRACRLISNGTYQIKPLISHEFPLSRIMDAFDTLEHKPKDYLKGLVYPD